MVETDIAHATREQAELR